MLYLDFWTFSWMPFMNNDQSLSDSPIEVYEHKKEFDTRVNFKINYDEEIPYVKQGKVS